METPDGLQTITVPASLPVKRSLPEGEEEEEAEKKKQQLLVPDQIRKFIVSHNSFVPNHLTKKKLGKL